MTPLAPRRPRLAIAGGLSTALTATLSATGVLHGVDQYAVEHLMPWLQVPPPPARHVRRADHPERRPARRPTAALELWTYPAALLPSLRHRARRRLSGWRRPADAIVWCALWCAGNAIELAGKLSLRKPDLYHHHVTSRAFDTSLPSGHTIRALILAGAVAAAWRSGRARTRLGGDGSVRARRVGCAHPVRRRDRRFSSR